MENTQVDVVIGLQYGDEGKGKITNQLAASGNYHAVVRFNGGGNAGHTIYKDGKKIVTHLVPCGVLHGILSIIGPGCVLNIPKFFEELDYLKSNGFDTSLVKIAKNCHIVTQEHIDEDSLDTKIGTTKTGNGPAYRDKYARIGKRAEDFSELEPYIINLTNYIYSSPKFILAEGAQGFYLDIDHGDYPYVTSSHCGVGALLNNGFNYKHIRQVIGVSKCYSTYVGNKRFGEDSPVFDKIRSVGEEYGATTGRARQIDWLNMPEIMRSAAMNGVDKLVINKMDILRQIDDAWKLHDFINVCDCHNEKNFIHQIHVIVNDIMPGLEVEFQGSAE